MKKLYKSLRVFSTVLLLTGSFSAFAQDAYTNGVFVLNEGGAGSNNSSVSFISNNTETGIQNGIYATVNPTQEPLGDTGQSITFNGDYAYIVMNISNTIKVVNRETFEYVTTISEGLENPRYIAFAGGKGYVTNWGDGGDDSYYIAVLNPGNNTIETTIPTSFGIERILAANGKLYVAHKGGFGQGTLVSVIDPATNTISQTIEVGDVPESMIVEGDFLYVLCGGKPFWAPPQTYGKLVKISLADNTIADEKEFPLQHPSNLRAGADGIVYYTIDSGIYQYDLTATALPSEPLFTTTPQGAYGIYGMDVIDGKIYVGDAGNYSSPGHAYIYSTAGVLLEDYTVGVSPNGFYKANEGQLSNPDHSLSSKINIAPNPASNVFYINTVKEAAVKMFDISGRLVKDQIYSGSGVSVAGLQPGVYMVQITVDNNSSAQRLIIK